VSWAHDISLRRLEHAGNTVETTATVIAELSVTYPTYSRIMRVSRLASAPMSFGARVGLSGEPSREEAGMSTTTSRSEYLNETSTSNLIPHGALPGSDSADIFYGHEHGNVPISMFLVHNRPGEGPDLHRHPYAEIFVVHSGQARFDLNDAALTAGAGDVVIAPAGAAHRFTNTGPGELSMTCIHTSAEMESEWL
jgi:mannose-6-phosphate isomerase-like protein (cupin superfamily)